MEGCIGKDEVAIHVTHRINLEWACSNLSAKKSQLTGNYSNH